MLGKDVNRRWEDHGTTPTKRQPTGLIATTGVPHVAGGLSSRTQSVTGEIDALDRPIIRTNDFTAAVDANLVAGTAILMMALVIGLATAGHYGMTIDEFNTDDYGPKALAWYTSGFTDRSHFETVEFSLWYYGPWFQLLTALVQSLGLADPVTVRHAMTFLIGITGLATLLPIARFSVGRWAGPAALILCLITGYLYGGLFFSPIDVPFLAAMGLGTLAIVHMARQVVPTWGATICAGLATGLAIATRTGGIITHAYLVGAMALCGLEAFALNGRAARSRLWAIAIRTAAVVAIGWVIAVALWPWLQIGNPVDQFRIAYVHFANISEQFGFLHWGEEVQTDDLPWSYIPGQWLARLPVGFLGLLALAVVFAFHRTFRFLRTSLALVTSQGVFGLRHPILLLARSRRILLVWVAAFGPVGFLVIQHATLYDGVRHTLFVIPMLALLAGWAFARLLRLASRARIAIAMLSAVSVVAAVIDLARLHPLEYVAINAFAGGTSGACGRFELDYWGAAATEALRRLEHRLDSAETSAPNPPAIFICVPFREQMVGPMLRRNWKLALEAKQADLVIETERSRCAKENLEVMLIDQVVRDRCPFSWTYVKRNSPFAKAVHP
jgi:hypothetical protein